MIPKTILTALALLAVAAFPAVGAAEADTVNVTLVVDHAGDAYDKTCDVTVAAGADGVAVLEAALADGCILDYQTSSYEGYGTFVDSIDYVPGVCYGYPAACTYWALLINGDYASEGVDAYAAEAGDIVEFSYDTITLV